MQLCSGTMEGKSNTYQLLDDKSAEFFTRSCIHQNSATKVNTFCWQNISVWSNNKVKQGIWRRTVYREVQLLNKVNGFIQHGSLVAIMGPSGSGKTTLLAAISSRIKVGIHGNVYVNGETISADQMLTLSGFVPQDDLTVESLTVFEHMKIMSILKMDTRISEVQRLKKVLIIMEDIGIRDIASSYICDLSGGERRKLSIAVQMLTDPPLLFCDEPTTGLDSANAAVVVKMLKTFSDRGKIVICSIHQPAAAIFELFDKVLLLASGGRVAYLGSVPNAIDYFQRLNLTCPENYNISEFLINQISISSSGGHENVRNLCDTYATSKLAAIVEERIKAVCFDNYLSSDQRSSFFLNQKQSQDMLIGCYMTEKATLLTQCKLLLERSFRSLRKDYLNFATHVFIYFFTAIMISSIFAPVTLCSDNNLQNIRGFITCMVLETIYEFAYFEFNTFAEERDLFMREINNGLYTVEAYCISKFCSKLLLSSLLPLLYVTIMQSISHAFDHLLFWELALPFIVIASTGTAYGCMLSAIFDNVNVLLVVAISYECPAYLLSGIALKLSSLPPIFNILRYFSFFYYAIEYVVVLEWQQATNIYCIDDITPDKNNIKQLSPLEFLDEYGYSIERYKDNLWILISLIITFYFVAYKVILRKSKRQVAY